MRSTRMRLFSVQNAGIIGANLSKIQLVSCNKCAKIENIE